MINSHILIPINDIYWYTFARTLKKNLFATLLQVSLKFLHQITSYRKFIIDFEIWFILQTLHRLAARAVIKDWEDGSLSEDRTQHELLKREMKEKIVDLSIKHSIVTQFTSFVAIEKREDGEIFDEKFGPSMEDLLMEEDIDFLDYMAFDSDMKDLEAELCAEEIEEDEDESREFSELSHFTESFLGDGDYSDDYNSFAEYAF